MIRCWGSGSPFAWAMVTIDSPNLVNQNHLVLTDTPARMARNGKVASRGRLQYTLILSGGPGSL